MERTNRQSRYLLPFASDYLQAAHIGKQAARRLRGIVKRLPEILGIAAPLIQDAAAQYGEIRAWVEANRSQNSAGRIMSSLRTLLQEGERQGLCELPAELRRFRALAIPVAQPDAAHQMLLTDALAQYFALKALSRRSTEFLRYVVRVFERWAGDALTLTAACERLNEFIAWLPSKYAPYSAKSVRRGVLVILKSAERDGHCTLPKRIRSAPTPELNPRGFTASELTALMAHADPCQRALISLAFDTGLRLCDLERLTWADVDEDSLTVRLVQKKTHRVHTAPVSAPTLALCRELQATTGNPDDPRLIPLRYARREFYRKWRKLGARAGVVLGGRAMQAVRRTAATLISREHGEFAAANFLGHAASSGVVVFAAHYRVKNVLPQRPPAPSRDFGLEAGQIVADEKTTA